MDVLTDVADGVATIALNRLAKKNAITSPMYQAMADALRAADADLAVRCIVIHGSADADNPLLAEIVSGLAARYRDVPRAAVRFVRWAPESDERLRAAATAQVVGARLGGQPISSAGWSSPWRSTSP